VAPSRVAPSRVAPSRVQRPPSRTSLTSQRRRNRLASISLPGRHPPSLLTTPISGPASSHQSPFRQFPPLLHRRNPRPRRRPVARAVRPPRRSQPPPRSRRPNRDPPTTDRIHRKRNHRAAPADGTDLARNDSPKRPKSSPRSAARRRPSPTSRLPLHLPPRSGAKATRERRTKPPPTNPASPDAGADASGRPASGRRIPMSPPHAPPTTGRTVPRIPSMGHRCLSRKGPARPNPRVRREVDVARRPRRPIPRPRPRRLRRPALPIERCSSTSPRAKSAASRL